MFNIKQFFAKREQQVLCFIFGFIAGFFACLLFMTALKLALT